MSASSPAAATQVSGFRRWRRTRPFWGGAFAVAAGAELILIPLAPMPLAIHQGIAGVASWLIGALLIVAGLGLWFQPQQHTFYGIVALLLAVSSFVTANLGGFVLGMLLGMIGGALGFAWGPREAVRQEPDGDSPQETGRHRVPNADTPAPTPHPVRSDPNGRHTGRAMAVAVLPAALGAGLFGTAPAEPSPAPLPTLSILPAPSASTTPTPPSTTPPVTTPAPQVSAVPSPTPSADRADTPCPQPPSATGLSRQEALQAMKETCAEPGTARAASGLPVTTSDAVTLRADRMSMSGLSYDGVVDLPTSRGTVRALRFTMDETTLTAVDQTIQHGPLRARATADTLAFSGDVVMYTTAMSGKVFGTLPVTFTPDSPPPLVLSSMSLTDVVTEHPHVLADSADADGFAVVS
ncbi:MAG: DUF6114 domain-containing protein [Actinomadura sp.]